jgi:hypothetical protein
MDVSSAPLAYVVTTPAPQRGWSRRTLGIVMFVALGLGVGGAVFAKFATSNSAPPLIIAGYVPDGFGDGTTVGKLAKTPDTPRRLRGAYFRNPQLGSRNSEPFLVHVLVTKSSEYRSCNSYVSWAAEGPDKPIDITIGNPRLVVTMEKLVSARDSGRSTRQQTCYSGRTTFKKWYVNIVSFAAPTDVQDLLRAVSFSSDGVPEFGSLADGWIRVDPQETPVLQGKVIYPAPSEFEGPIVITTMAGEPETQFLSRSSRSLNGRTVWMETINDSVIRTRAATVLVNGVYASVVARTTQDDFDRLLGNLRIARSTDRRNLVRVPTFEIGNTIVMGDEQQTGTLPNGERWRLVARIDLMTRARSRSLGIVSRDGAVVSVDQFPRTTSINWMRTGPNLTIIAIPASSRPKSITATVKGKSYSTVFLPTKGVWNQYAFLPVELTETDVIEVRVGIDARIRTAKDFQWEPPDRHL